MERKVLVYGDCEKTDIDKEGVKYVAIETHEEPYHVVNTFDSSAKVEHDLGIATFSLNIIKKLFELKKISK